MTKIFPKSRICVIDAYPSFENGLKTAIDFASKNNITLGSADGRRLILGFCLKFIENTYKTTPSQFPKVLCISKAKVTKKVSNFVDNYFDDLLTKMPVPYCGIYDLNSPDLESAAENSLAKQKPQRKFNSFTSKMKFKSN